MDRHRLAASLLAFAALSLAPLSVQAAPRPCAQEPALGEQEARRRDEILELARRYADLRWRAGEEHVLHGEDPDGTRVDTPDVSLAEDGWHSDGRENVGMPYAWGGFTSLEELEPGLADGLFAGHVPTTEHAFSSRHALGLDCSGFVSRCWGLPQKQSTRSLGALSYELSGYDELRPGDILNKFDSHVALFAGFADPEHTQVRVVEAARLKVEEVVYPASELKGRGFVPMRYKPLDARWVPMDHGAPAFEPEEGAHGRFRADGGESTLSELSNPLTEVTPGEWARYSATDADSGPIEITSTRMVAGTGTDGVEVQTIRSIEGQELCRGATRDPAAPAFEALVDFAGFSEPFRGLQVTTSRVESGTYELGGRVFPARRIDAVLEGSLLVRHALYPIVLEVQCVQSDAVPLAGVLEATYRIEVTWKETKDGDRTVSQNEKGFALEAFGGPEG